MNLRSSWLLPEVDDKVDEQYKRVDMSYTKFNPIPHANTLLLMYSVRSPVMSLYEL